MTDMIVIAIIVVILAVAGKGAWKHLKGEGSCCGGSSSKVKKKKLKGTIVSEKVICIDGMHCDHCRNSVERALNALEGVACHANLHKNQAVVKMTAAVSDEVLREAVERAGFSVTEIKEV